jgi:hypothetical protein
MFGLGADNEATDIAQDVALAATDAELTAHAALPLASAVHVFKGVKVALVAGQDEGGDATIPVTGIAVGDSLAFVAIEDGTSGKWTLRALADFTITADTLTVVANAANNAANSYIIGYVDLT